MSVAAVEKKEYHPLSSAQKRLYILQQMELASMAYNMPEFIPLEVESDLTKIEETFKKLIKRHENFRTSYYMVKDEPVQRIHEEVEFELEYYDTSKDEAEDISKTFVRAFDLSQAPLLHVGLLKLPHTPNALRGHPSPAAPTTHQGESSGNRYILKVDMHHIISDGVTHQLLVKDFMELYEGKALPPLRIQYKDFSQWQNRLFAGSKIKTQEAYWFNLYRDAGEITRLNLLTDYKRPEVFTFAGDSYFLTWAGKTAPGSKPWVPRTVLHCI